MKSNQKDNIQSLAQKLRKSAASPLGRPKTKMSISPESHKAKAINEGSNYTEDVKKVLVNGLVTSLKVKKSQNMTR